MTVETRPSVCEVGAADEKIRQLCIERRLDDATAEVLRKLGPEILGLLIALHRDHDEASDAFSIFAEKVWTSIERFEWKSTIRTWAYVLARRASCDVLRKEKRERRRVSPLSECPVVQEMEARVRTTTLTLLRTETKSELTRLRETLSADDQLLLVLRIDRKLTWDELALVLRDPDTETAAAHATLAPDDLKREAARLRKRFQLVKGRLHALAMERGLLRP